MNEKRERIKKRKNDERSHLIESRRLKITRCCRCRRGGGLFDPLSLFPPDLSRGHAYRVFFNREIHEVDLPPPAATVRDLRESISPEYAEWHRQFRKSGSRRGRSGSRVSAVRCHLHRFVSKANARY